MFRCSVSLVIAIKRTAKRMC